VYGDVLIIKGICGLHLKPFVNKPKRISSMKTGNRKPKLNKKPTTGMKQFMKQGANTLKKVMRGVPVPGATKKNWYTPKAVRAQWLLSFKSGRYMPHQGPQECARRVRQMAAGTHGY
jgi:hypothetical protein